MNIKKMLTFLFWVPKMPKNGQNYFYTYINLWTTIKLGFQEQLLMKNPRKNLQGFYLVNVGQKR